MQPSGPRTWVDVVDLLQGQEQRGVVRAPLRAIAEAVGAPLELVVELASAGVLCGSDDQGATFSWAATHAGMRGDPVKAGGCSRRLLLVLPCTGGGRSLAPDEVQSQPTLVRSDERAQWIRCTIREQW
ncbi:hypothetical protein SNK04_014058 [Fusarium graminearum]